MSSSLSRRSAPQRRVARAQRRGGQSRRQPRIPGPVNFRPVRSYAQQKPRGRPHRPVGRQPGPESRSRRPQGLQQLLRRPQIPPGQQPHRLRGQGPVQGAGGRHQHRPPVRGTEAVSAVPQGRQLRRAVSDPNPHRQELPLHAVARHPPEYHGEYRVGRRPRHRQSPGVHICVQHAVHRRNAAPRQQSQPQHTARHSAGDREKQQSQPQQLLLAAVGRQRQQHPRRQLHRGLRQEAQPRQEHRRRVNAPQQPRQGAAPPPQRQARQPGGAEEEQVVHQGVQHEHAVDVNDRHRVLSFLPGVSLAIL